jgi:hypothetical protein
MLRARARGERRMRTLAAAGGLERAAAKGDCPFAKNIVF